MAGGINAWNGLVAEGPYESGLAYFTGASGAEELISLSFALEEGNRAFYERMSKEAKGGETPSVFRSLSRAEERHKETLRELFARISGKTGDPPTPEGIPSEPVLEGGASLPETLAWAEDKPLRDILEFAVAMEADALDRYIKMGRAVSDERSREVFLALSKEERDHLNRMTALLERLLGKG